MYAPCNCDLVNRFLYCHRWNICSKFQIKKNVITGKKASQKSHDVTLHLNVLSLERKLIHVSSISNRFSTSAKMHFFHAMLLANVPSNVSFMRLQHCSLNINDLSFFGRVYTDWGEASAAKWAANIAPAVTMLFHESSNLVRIFLWCQLQLCVH